MNHLSFVPDFNFSHPFLASILVKFIFNRKVAIKSVTLANLEASRSNENENAVASNEISLSFSTPDSTVAQNVVARDEKPGLETGLVAEDLDLIHLF